MKKCSVISGQLLLSGWWLPTSKKDEKNDDNTTTGAVLLQLFRLFDTFFVCLLSAPPYFAHPSTHPTPWRASLQN